MKLTAKMLRDKKACAGELRLFHRITGGEVDITVEWCCENAPKFDWDWAAANLLTAPARAAYVQAKAAAMEAFGQAKAAAWAIAYNSQEEAK
jgi:hypothetical protein